MKVLRSLVADGDTTCDLLPGEVSLSFSDSQSHSQRIDPGSPGAAADNCDIATKLFTNMEGHLQLKHNDKNYFLPE